MFRFPHVLRGVYSFIIQKGWTAVELPVVLRQTSQSWQFASQFVYTILFTRTGGHTDRKVPPKSHTAKHSIGSIAPFDQDCVASASFNYSFATYKTALLISPGNTKSFRLWRLYI